MASLRKPFQGVSNIVRFNWHFYLIAASVVAILQLSNIFYQYSVVADFACALIFLVTFTSLAVSAYVYDFSGLYNLRWLTQLNLQEDASIITISAGFDELSELLSDAFPRSNVTALDFYDPLRHSEVSIKRARCAYPAFPGTKAISTDALPVENEVADAIFLFLAAHEIRDDKERTKFFQEIARVIKPSGRIIVVEHLRNCANFLAYTVGFFHFLSRRTWLHTFDAAKLNVDEEFKITPFINIFILKKNGTSP